MHPLERRLPHIHSTPLLLALLAACSATHSSSAPRSEPSRLLSDVKWLADDAREGRRAGTEQGRVAGEWIAARFRTLGLEPAGTPSGANAYLQEFTVPLDAKDGGASSVMTTDENMWRAPTVVPLFCSERGEVTAPLVFCGFGIESEERGWNDYQDKEIQGAIAFIVRGTPRSSARTRAGGLPARSSRRS
jgi:hypothetical protein